MSKFHRFVGTIALAATGCAVFLVWVMIVIVVNPFGVTSVIGNAAWDLIAWADSYPR